MPYFQYGAEEMDYLRQQDSRLGAVVEKAGFIRRTVMPDVFAALVYTITGQQISSKAQETVWQRLVQHVGAVTPQGILAVSADDLRACGLSQVKVGYMRQAAERVLDGHFEPEALRHLPDADCCRCLTALAGVGRWTAEMLLLFSLQRPDVLSFGDFGIRRGLEILHHIEKIDKKTFSQFQRLYSPHGSVASFYLWAVAGGAVAVP